MNVSKCYGCPALIVWLLTESGARMCVNANHFTDEELEAPAPLYDTARHQAGVHWATCPRAKQFRGKKR